MQHSGRELDLGDEDQGKVGQVHCQELLGIGSWTASLPCGNRLDFFDKQ